MALPDLIEIVPLTAPVRAEITVPGSKSITNRALILAALADGEVTLTGALWSEDTEAMFDCLQKLGFEIRKENNPDELCNRTITVKGLGGKIPNGGTAEKPLELFVGNAGTAARFLAAFVCLGHGVYRLHGVARMHERPQAALFAALRELGYRVEAENGNDKLPARIYGGATERGSVSRSTSENENATAPSEVSVSGEAAAGRRPALRDKNCRVSIAESSQFASALLLSAGIGGWQVEIVGENADESPYVAMTSKLMEAFPKNGGTFQIEPDASSGSYFWGASWFLAKMEERDYSAAQIARYEAADQKQASDKFVVKPLAQQSFVYVFDWPTSGWQLDADFAHFFPVTEFHPLPERISREDQLADSIMTAIVLAAAAGNFFGVPKHVSFEYLGRLRVQECERVVALRTELTKCGAKVVEEGDTLTVWPSQLHGAEIETYNDHRMAMCFAILGLKVPGIKIKNPACVKKTFPNFFQKLAAAPPHGLGAEIWEIQNGQRTRKLSGEDLFAD